MSLCDPIVFVVDDEPAVRNSVAALASSMGLDCQTFPSAEQFLEHFDPSQAGCAVIDLRLDGMNGLELLDNISGRNHGFPVIFMSAYLDISIAVRAMKNGAITVLEKPCQMEQLDQAICKAMDMSRNAQKTNIRRSDLLARYNDLEPREREILLFVVNGVPNKTIARELSISMRTAARIRATVYDKMGTDSAVELARMFIELQKSGTEA